MQPGASGPGRDAEGLGDLDQGQSAVVMEHEYRSMLERQPPERPIEDVPVGMPSVSATRSSGISR